MQELGVKSKRIPSNDKQESYHTNETSTETLQKEIAASKGSDATIELEKRHKKRRIEKEEKKEDRKTKMMKVEDTNSDEECITELVQDDIEDDIFEDDSLSFKTNCDSLHDSSAHTSKVMFCMKESIPWHAKIRSMSKDHMLQNAKMSKGGRS